MRGIILLTLSLTATRTAIGLHAKTNSFYLRDDFFVQPSELSLTRVRDDKTAEIAENLRLFVEASGGKRAYILTHGDSTMSGLSARINQATDTQILYGFQPGGKKNWGAESLIDNLGGNSPLERKQYYPDFPEVFDNIQSTFNVISKCGGNLGGSIFVTAHLNGSLIKYNWGFSPENYHSCWDQCLTDAVGALKTNAVIINLGLHLLHINPGRPCNRKIAYSYWNCGDYEATVENVLGSIKAVSPITLWRTTNWVCNEKFDANWRELVKNWHDPEKSVEMENQCHKDCEDFSDGRPCADEVMDAWGTSRQHELSLNAVDKVKAKGGSGRIGLVDAFNITESQCDKTVDAKHYHSLDNDILLSMTKELIVQAKVDAK